MGRGVTVPVYGVTSGYLCTWMGIQLHVEDECTSKGLHV